MDVDDRDNNDGDNDGGDDDDGNNNNDEDDDDNSDDDDNNSDDDDCARDKSFSRQQKIGSAVIRSKLGSTSDSFGQTRRDERGFNERYQLLKFEEF